jgi:putative Mn2+ efflux pump MntP
MLEVAVVRPAVIIGVVTLVISFAGVYLGKRCSGLFQSRVGTAGGFILLGIASRFWLSIFPAA